MTKETKSAIHLCMYVCVFIALVTTVVMCARSQDLVLSGSMRRVHDVLSTARFKGGGKPCRKTRETAALRRGIRKASRTERERVEFILSQMKPKLRYVKM